MKTKTTIAAVLMLVGLTAFASDKTSLSSKEAADQLIVFAAGYCRGTQEKNGTDFTGCFMQLTDFAIAKLQAKGDKSAGLADETNALVLDDGTTAWVVASRGTTHGYLKDAPVGSDGTVHLVPGEVFEGEKVAKKPDGTCVLVRTKLISIDASPRGQGHIQVPKTTTDTAVADCNT